MLPPLLLLLLGQHNAAELPPVPTPDAVWAEAAGECSNAGGSSAGWVGWSGNHTDPFNAGTASLPTGHPGRVCPVIPKDWSLARATKAFKDLCDTDVKCVGVQLFTHPYGVTPPGYNFSVCFREGTLGAASTSGGRAGARCYKKLPPPPESKSVHNLSYISARRFPIEGWLPPITMCTAPPLLPFEGFPVKAMLNQPTKHNIYRVAWRQLPGPCKLELRSIGGCERQPACEQRHRRLLPRLHRTNHGQRRARRAVADLLVAECYHPRRGGNLL